jgi:hypothetical protein
MPPATGAYGESRRAAGGLTSSGRGPNISAPGA